MHAQTLCAEVARRLGEPERLVARRGFQPLRHSRKSSGPALAATNCPFCGGQVLVPPGRGRVEAECRRCDTAFEVQAADVYTVALDDAERPGPRRFLHEVW